MTRDDQKLVFGGFKVKTICKYIKDGVSSGLRHRKDPILSLRHSI